MKDTLKNFKRVYERARMGRAIAGLAVAVAFALPASAQNGRALSNIQVRTSSKRMVGAKGVS